MPPTLSSTTPVAHPPKSRNKVAEAVIVHRVREAKGKAAADGADLKAAVLKAIGLHVAASKKPPMASAVTEVADGLKSTNKAVA